MTGNIDTVFLDMDGVLVDFDWGWRHLLSSGNEGMSQLIDQYDAKHEGRQYPWDFWQHLGLGESDFWKLTDSDRFWSCLPWTVDGVEILHHIEEMIHPSKIFLLTRPPLVFGAYSGKYLWVKKNMPDYCDRLIVTGHKYTLARKGALLVDDSDANVDKFITCGGMAVRIPRRWNRMHRYIPTYKKLGVRDWFEVSGVVTSIVT